jgi:hypothetical protein
MSEEEHQQDESTEQESTDEKVEELLDALVQERRKQADVLVVIAKRGKLFHTPDGIAYADISHKGHRETWAARSPGYRKYLVHCFYDETKSAPNKDAVSTALGVIEAEAVFNGEEHPVAIRVGGHGSRIYLDLCNDNWQVIEIDADGWRTIDESPIRFIRTNGMLPLPLPIARGGTRDGVEALRKFVNIKGRDPNKLAIEDDDADFVLVKAWLLAAFRPTGPYPLLALIGQHGSAKSTTLRILRALIDPNSHDLRAPPRNPDDLYIAAAHSHLVPIDNVSSITDWLSDALCRIATGMSYAKRMLFTDQDEVLIRAMRPQAITSVVECIENPDLGDRAIILVPPRIGDENRREEEEIYKTFEIEQPSILAALLSVVAHGLRTLPNITHKKWPRMADFAKWATACEGAHDTVGSFAKAYSENRASAVNTILGEDMVGSVLLRLKLPWSGTAGALLNILTDLVGEQLRRSKDWPKSPHKLGAKLRRLIVFLREVGIDVEPPGKADKSRTWSIRAVENPPPDTSPKTSPDCKPLKPNGLGDVGEVGDVLRGMTVNDPDFNQRYPEPFLPCKTSPTSPEKPENGKIANNGNVLQSGEVSGEVLGEVPTSPDALVCEHCGSPATPDSPVLPCAVKGRELLLHSNCQVEWLGGAQADEVLDIPQFLRRTPHQ